MEWMNLRNLKSNNSVLAVLFFTAIMLLQGCHTAPENAKSFKSIFDHYRDLEGITAISFPPGLVGVFLSEDNSEQAELKKLMQDLSAFRMLVIDHEAAGHEGSGTLEEMRNLVTGFTDRNGFLDLFRIQNAEQDIFIRILEKDGVVKEAILMMGADDGFFVIDLRGNISSEHFSRLVEGGYLNELTSLADIGF